MSLMDKWKDREIVDADWNLDQDKGTLTATFEARMTPVELDEIFDAGREELRSSASSNGTEALGRRHPHTAYALVLKVLAELVASELDALQR